ncbi:hypothetical protein B0H11DRAFT_2107913 [Mycena galericulata]|nr:hypothetical protein B0H11DRAFT_2107913 [Mycena galericulata]
MRSTTDVEPLFLLTRPSLLPASAVGQQFPRCGRELQLQQHGCKLCARGSSTRKNTARIVFSSSFLNSFWFLYSVFGMCLTTSTIRLDLRGEQEERDAQHHLWHDPRTEPSRVASSARLPLPASATCSSSADRGSACASALKNPWVARPPCRTLEDNAPLAALVEELVLNTELSSQDPAETLDLHVVTAGPNVQHPSPCSVQR